jgi:2TM domain
MPADAPDRDELERKAFVRRVFRWHLLVYGGVMGATMVVNFVIGGGWWSFWPICAWGLVLAFHFFYYKSVTVDEAWVQERTDDMRLRSYDLSHIHDIEDRVEQRDASVRPADER